VTIVTERAKQELQKALSAHITGYTVFRMIPSSRRRFELVLDREREGDQVVECEGHRVLLLGSGVSEALEGWTIDCKETTEELRLVISK
jgi:hypothetical protein